MNDSNDFIYSTICTSSIHQYHLENSLQIVQIFKKLCNLLLFIQYWGYNRNQITFYLSKYSKPIRNRR